MGQHFLITDAELSLLFSLAQECPLRLGLTINNVLNVVAQRPIDKEAPSGDLEP